jgi:hypothetical protein
MRAWTKEEEANRLAQRFVKVNRAAFAREFKVPGGPGMIQQHLNGTRPISMEAAIAYARGFGVGLLEISPRLAKVAMKALGIEVTALGVKPTPDKFADLHRLPEDCQAAILLLAQHMLARSVLRVKVE